MWKDRLKGIELIGGVIVIALTIAGAAVGATIWITAHIDDAKKQGEDALRLAKNNTEQVTIVRAQAEDTLDARIAGVTKEISKYEESARKRELTPTELQRLRDLRSDYDRLRKLRYGGKNKP